MARLRSQPCEGNSRVTGLPCRNQAVLGARFCRSHGAALPNVRREAAENVAKAIALQRESRNPLAARERRHPAVVLLDAVHTLDTLHDVAKKLLDSGGDELSPDQWLHLTSAAERAARAAKMVFEARADDAFVKVMTVDAEALARVLQAALSSLDLDPDREAVARAAMRRELEAIDAERAGGVRAIEAAP